MLSKINSASSCLSLLLLLVVVVVVFFQLLFNYSCPHFPPITLSCPTPSPPPTFSPPCSGSSIFRKTPDLGGFKVKVEDGNVGGLGLRPLERVPTWCIFPPKSAIIYFPSVFFRQGNFYPDYLSLRAKSTLHLSRIVLLFSEWE